MTSSRFLGGTADQIIGFVGTTSNTIRIAGEWASIEWNIQRLEYVVVQISFRHRANINIT
jgi:hypothetical protein